MRDHEMKTIDPYRPFVKKTIDRQVARSLRDAHGGAVVLPGPGGVQQPAAEPIRQYPPVDQKLYNLTKHHTPGPNDTCFDLQAWYLAPAGVNFVPLVGNQVAIFQQQFPQGRDFILTRYNFGIVLDERPGIQHMTLANPIEFVGALDFIITADDSLPFDMSYQASGGATYNREGLPILTENPEEAGTPIYGAFHVRVRGGQTLRVIFRNHAYNWGMAFPYSRRIYGCGCRLRGFYATEDPTKEKEIKT